MPGIPLPSGMTEPRAPLRPAPAGVDGAARLHALVDRSAPPHRPVGELLRRWYAASGTSLRFDEWADPATRALADACAGTAGPAEDAVPFARTARLDAARLDAARLDAVDDAVVAFAQARAGADHDLAAVTADLVSLVRLAWPAGVGAAQGGVDPVGLLARALGAWAVDTAATACGTCLDAVTGLVNAGYLRERVRELHRLCRALGLSPATSFGALVVGLDTDLLATPDRIGVRVAAARLLTARFRAGETVAAVGATRMVAIMPADAVDRAVDSVRSDLTGLCVAGSVGVTVDRQPFSTGPDGTFAALAGTRMRP